MARPGGVIWFCRAIYWTTICWREGRGMGIVVVRSPKCLRGLLRRLFGLKG